VDFVLSVSKRWIPFRPLVYRFFFFFLSLMTSGRLTRGMAVLVDTGFVISISRFPFLAIRDGLLCLEAPPEAEASVLALLLVHHDDRNKLLVRGLGPQALDNLVGGGQDLVRQPPFSALQPLQLFTAAFPEIDHEWSQQLSHGKILSGVGLKNLLAR
jgi:hypothetical protein